MVDRDVSQWCKESDIEGAELKCCQTNLCNHAKLQTSFKISNIIIFVFFVFQNIF